MLAESGYTPPPKPKQGGSPAAQLFGEVAYRNRYSHEIVECEATPISKAELAKISNDYKGTSSRRAELTVCVPPCSPNSAEAMAITSSI